jgi:putative ubiquitin-RnfH superfamily antitoxin RatB of RatAB toxin-antitoxin module
VVAQQLFTNYVKRKNAITKIKAAHRITVSRFFWPLPASPKERNKKRREMRNKNEKIAFSSPPSGD